VSSTRGIALVSSGNSAQRASTTRDGRCVALIRRASVRYLVRVNRLIDYIRQNVMIDFQGDLSVAKVRELLAGDESRDARALLTKLVADRKVEDMLVVLADCLLETVQKALSDDVVREQLRMYAES
jgi:hypothetical protein